MLKGAQKRMVVLRTASSTMFETAYFVLRDGTDEGTSVAHRSMLEEANRILAESLSPHAHANAKKNKRAARRRALLVFSLGFVVGAFVCIALFLAFLP
ncbi:MAG: hypothetical protein IJW40_07825 [Clostridia bacterium]|nr:hypothetical protein [Clostridia bacterium]